MSYTLNQWDYLTRYTSDGRMPIDNNILERDIRVFDTGRKSWLLSDTVDDLLPFNFSKTTTA